MPAFVLTGLLGLSIIKALVSKRHVFHKTAAVRERAVACPTSAHAFLPLRVFFFRGAYLNPGEMHNSKFREDRAARAPMS